VYVWQMVYVFLLSGLSAGPIQSKAVNFLSIWVTISFFKNKELLYFHSCTMMKEAVVFHKFWYPLQITRHHIPEHSNLHIHRFS
jgi:hypothetical protein